MSKYSFLTNPPQAGVIVKVCPKYGNKELIGKTVEIYGIDHSADNEGMIICRFTHAQPPFNGHDWLEWWRTDKNNIKPISALCL